jgi:hypothetical protein
MSDVTVCPECGVQITGYTVVREAQQVMTVRPAFDDGPLVPTYEDPYVRTKPGPATATYLPCEHKAQRPPSLP